LEIGRAGARETVNSTETELLVETARLAAQVGGLVLREYARDLDGLIVDEKSVHDYVTAADRASEKAIVKFLRERHPDHSILAEESPEERLPGPCTWIIDPLDGTTNFIHGYPVYSVSIALQQGDAVIAGAVYDPVRDEMFHAGADQGAFLNGDPIHVSSRTGLGGCLLATGFPFKIHDRLKDYLRSFEVFARSTAGIRRAGSAALDLCNVACGRFDGFWEMSLAPWDVAAGGLIVHEAGGRATDFLGSGAFLKNGNIVAAAPRVHAAMLEVLRRTLV
jgi:myo-inositol-1(or 4)-monophosphatase